MTPQEVKLWAHLRTWRADGYHFRRQAPRAGYVLDFVCLKHNLVVEIDGGQHARHGAMAHDARRDATLRRSGLRVLRFWNVDVDRNLAGVLDAIRMALGADETAPTGPRPGGQE